MPIISDRTTIYNRDGTSETVDADQARYRTYFEPGKWSLTWPAPDGWESTTPRYLASRAVQPATRARYRLEKPFSSMGDDSWQYGDRLIEAGEIVETACWPHPSFRPAGPIDDPAHYAASRVLEFFNSALRSRLPVSPMHQGRLRLDNGISNAPTFIDARPPSLRPDPTFGRVA